LEGGGLLGLPNIVFVVGDVLSSSESSKVGIYENRWDGCFFGCCKEKLVYFKNSDFMKSV
ncbi:16594_t:CDS:2, partial [Gigaspora margarita]